MGRPLRVIVLVTAISAALIAVSPPTPAAAALGDVIGVVFGGGQQPPPSGSPQPGPSPEPTPQPGTTVPERPVSRDSKLLAPESSCPGQADRGLSTGRRERTMICMLSYARVAKGLRALRLYRPLRVSAVHKARDIRRCHRFSHEACDREAFYWVQRVGFFKRPSLAGEILAFGRRRGGTPLSTMRQWLGSSTHRAVILHRGFDLVGVGSIRARLHGSRVTLWVAHLGYRHR
jgi:uncharacterized protein YkwD